MIKKIQEKLSLLLIVLLLLALASIVLAIIKIGFVLWFWIILIIWLAILFLYFFTGIFKVALWFWVAFAIWFVFSFLLSFGWIPGLDTAGSDSNTKTANLPEINGIKLSDCTSKASDTPKMLEGWKVTIYSAPYIGKGSNEVSNANSVRTFSYKALVDKTDPNSMHTRFEKADGDYITGYNTTMEVCNQDNKANYSYVTKYNNDSKGAGENVIASVNYFHGGKYVFAPGTYRIDAYIKDIKGAWHLVDRMNGITITE